MDAQQIVCRRGKHEGRAEFYHASDLQFSQQSDCLEPTKYFLNPFSFNLVDRIAVVARGSSINTAATGGLLRDVRRDIEFPQLVSKCRDVVALVACACPLAHASGVVPSTVN